MKKLACSLFVSMMLFGTVVHAQPEVYYDAPAVVRGTSAGLNWVPALVAVPIVIAIIAGVASGDNDGSVHSDGGVVSHTHS